MNRELEVGGRLGPYRVEEVLGEGAVGVVYRAVRETDGEVVALKVLRPELSANSVYEQRFLREARVAKEVEHRHLVGVLDAGVVDGCSYLVVAYVAGSSLKEKIDAEGPLELGGILRVADGVGSALDALHRAGLVHRDVKPANIMLAPDGSALLTDFGLAKGPAYTVLTRPGQLMGTPAYLAPELINGAEATRASDVYALGCTLYECIAGNPPFASSNVFEIVVGHLEGEPENPCRGRLDLPPELFAAVRPALAKDPAQRPATGGMLARLVAAAARSGG